MVVRAGAAGVAVVLGLLSLALAAGVGGAATKAEGEIARQKQEARGLARAIAVMEGHIGVAPDGTLALDREGLAGSVAAGDARGVRAGTFRTLEAALLETNRRIERGETTASEVFSGDGEPEAVSAQRRCDGRNGTVYRWWGYRTYFDDCATHSLVRLLLAGASANALAAFFGWAPGGLIGPILAIGGIVIDGIDERGGHDGVHFTKVHGARVVVWHQ